MEGDVQIEEGAVSPEQLEEIKDGEYVTVKYIATKLAYSTQWVLWMMKQGRIKGIKPLGGRWRIPRSEFDRILKEGSKPMPREPAKPPVTEIEVEEEVASRIVEEPKKKDGKKIPFPLDFSGIFGGGKKE